MRFVEMLLLLILLFAPLNGEIIYMYYSSDQSKRIEHDFDCFDYHEDYVAAFYRDEVVYKEMQQIIPFCRRDDIHDGLIISDSRISAFTFDQLKERNVNSRDLYAWLAPIDLIEHYQAFREGRMNNISSFKFYNCSSVNRFGSLCQYDIYRTGFSRLSFTEIVTEQLKARLNILTNGVCYVHLNCTRNNYSWCLHWEDICDTRIDCWPEPIDEEHCFELENNECDEDEYRCRDGQCIPQKYYMDSSIGFDCLDGTDEIEFPSDFSSKAPKNGDPSITQSDKRSRHPFSILSSGECVGASHCSQLNRGRFYSYLFARKNNPHLSDECWSTMICITDVLPTSFLNDSAHALLFNGSCDNICFNQTYCRQRMKQYCPPLFEFPAEPIAWHDVHLFYLSNQTDLSKILPDYVCFNKQSSDHWNSTMVIRKITNPATQLSCQMFEIVMREKYTGIQSEIGKIIEIFEQISALPRMETETNCSELTQFLCGKRCLSKHRLFDGTVDCADGSDELYTNSCSLNGRHRIFCKAIGYLTRIDGCIVEAFVSSKHLTILCNVTRKQVAHFPTLCDGYIEKEFRINGQIETDETNCEAWLCDNQYTRCDGIWNCLNGQDEIGCAYSYCGTKKGHPCLLWNSSQPICLPVSRAGDGIVDCIGATDERHLCRDQDIPIYGQQNAYQCWNNRSVNSQTVSNLQAYECINIYSLCDNRSTCLLNDDESLYMCQSHSTLPEDTDNRFCRWNGSPSFFLYCLLDDTYKRLMWGNTMNYAPCFHLADISFRPQMAIVNSQPLMSQTVHVENSVNDGDHAKLSAPMQSLVDLQSYPCHGGILVYMFRNESSSLSNSAEKRCFCPPAFYGKQCQYSSQRATVTLEIAVFEGEIPFSFMIYLLDNETDIIQSYYTINYLSTRDCQTKFGFHLLYSTRPKAPNRSYSVRIDAFQSITLKYRVSWVYPITFWFLPVYRLSILLEVPVEQPTPDQSCPLQCTQSYQCDCSSQLSCVGSWNNRSICICPLNKFGPRCYLTNNACEGNGIGKCRNGGLCVAKDIRLKGVTSSAACICSDAFYGETCQNHRSHINITFELANEYIPAYMFLHFIVVRSRPRTNYLLSTKNWGPHERVSTIQKIPIDSISVTIYWNDEFHLLFAQDQHNMYLLILQNEYQASINHNVTMKSSQRCRPIRELLNTTIVSFPSFRRVKYYHLPCQENLQLSCLCTHDRHLKSSCRNIAFCENAGECFQNNVTCPTAAICSCSTCYFGTRCQLTTKGFGLPLDVILGYQIWPNRSLMNQSMSLKISALITGVMFILGMANVSLSLLTFRIKRTREYGCGIYLCTTSIISLLTMITFALKFILLVLTQLTIIKSELFLTVQCYSIDFLLKIFLQIGEWLYACVSMERLFSSIKATKFNKNLSRKMAKWMIVIIFILVSGTSIHEAYYRHVFNDREDNRTWCIVRYPRLHSNFLTTYTTVMTIIHFMGPFLINIISSISNVLISTKYRTKADKRRTYLTNLSRQIQLFKYSLISPVVLVVLTTPRIILAFTLECMKSAREPVGLFLFAYFVSFIPPILTFVIYVLPSRDYKQAFRTPTKRCCCKG